MSARPVVRARRHRDERRGTAFSGLRFLVTAFTGQPLSSTFARALLEGRMRFTSEP